MLSSGAFWFGLVIGFITYRTLHHVDKTAVSDIAAVIGAVGGAAVLKLFPVGESLFDYYGVGLAFGVFGYLIVSIGLSLVVGPDRAKAMLERRTETGTGDRGRTF